MHGKSLDASESQRQAVLEALAAGTPLRIVGGGSKSFYGRATDGQVLDVSGHAGILDYQPTELVITARCGTPLSAIEAALAEKNQMLSFEPPHFGPEATLGGTVACGLSGPRRPYGGSVRDCVLGVRLLNGKGEILSFGGQVMKNVAGFDLSRLMVGALGVLGVVLEASLRVAPRPETEETLIFEKTAEQALDAMSRWSGTCLPLSAACHHGERLHLRLSGGASAISSSRKRLGGERYMAGNQFWSDLREQRLPFFQGDAPLWRFSVPPASPLPDLPGPWLIDWGGAQRWLKCPLPPEILFAAARSAGGHATLFRHGDRTGQVFQPLPPRLMELHLQLKKAFDPKGVFNPGRLYEEW